MDDSQKLNETTLPEKEEFYSNLNMEEITDANYIHGERVYLEFEIKTLGEYHCLYLKSDPLRLADVFENFRNMCINIYELGPAKFISALGLASQAAFKIKIEVKLELLTDIDILLIVEKVIRAGINHAIHQYIKANKNYMKDCNKSKESLYLKYWDLNSLYVWAMSQTLPVNIFEWIEDTSQFNEDFIKNYNEEGGREYFLKLMFST